MSTIVLKWGDRIVIDQCELKSVEFSVNWGNTGTDVPGYEAVILDQPTESPNYIKVGLDNVPFAMISGLKGLFYNAKLPTVTPLAETLYIGSLLTYDWCYLQSFRFSYDKIFTRHITTGGGVPNIGVYGTVSLGFIRSLAY
jgi:hypothetical protein